MAGAAAPSEGLAPGDVIWAQPEFAVGREQAGRRPALVLASADYLAIVDTLALVVPITSTNRGWPNHIEVIGAQLDTRCWAMSEQVRTITRERVVGHAGRANEATLNQVRVWLADFLDVRVR